MGLIRYPSISRGRGTLIVGKSGIKKERVNIVIKRFFESGEMAKEIRGGDRKSEKTANRRSAIHVFMESLKCTEPHYCRSQSACRVYLPPDLNLTKENLFCYVWNETVRPKSSNEIVSALFHRLVNINLAGKVHIKLFADCCGDQNKNTILIGMCCKWLESHAPSNIKTIEVIFPVVGHSYIPPDRVFGNIEKDLKKKEIIVSPEEYVTLIGRHGTVLRLGEEVAVFNWKRATQNVIKPPVAFQIPPHKKIYAGLIELGAFRSVTKKSYNISSINPQPLPCNIAVREDKVVSVSKLLQAHYGENWRRYELLNFYVNVELQKNVEEDMEENDVCELVEEAEHCLSI
ncbi:hypothetical protein NQ314_010115 [Rhamnusium bicolor]|uniref:DUF7869 domain-containing protein n=1 Tax=Rhamnusium bicolor TaxID=1586634 RepID=A0AAV8XT91_9CUCU|nr:hypothetical protein NQ314_010115 [Rhamnusium bicolor]